VAKEYGALRYYDDDTIDGYIDILRSAQVALEFFTSHLFYGGDYSRVFWGTDDIVFRRRVELVGQGIAEGQNRPYAQTLDLPFSCYNQTSDWDDDDRVAAKQAGQFVLGEYDEDFDATVRSAAVKSNFAITSFWNRRDDLRLASQLAFWERYTKYPFYFNHFVQFGRTQLGIPCYFQVETVNGNIDYKEGDWLQKSKIFPMKVELVCRTYQVLLRSVKPRIGGEAQSVPLRFRNHHQQTADYVRNPIIVEETLLDFGTSKFGFDKIPTKLPEKAWRAKSVDLHERGAGYKINDRLEFVTQGRRMVEVKVLAVNEAGGITRYTCDRAALTEDWEPRDDEGYEINVELLGGSGTGAKFRIKTEEFIPPTDIEVYTPERFTKGAIYVGPYEGEPSEYDTEYAKWTRDVIEGYFSPTKHVVFKAFGIERVPPGTLVNSGTGVPQENGIEFDPSTMLKVTFDLSISEDPLDFIDVLVTARKPIRIQPPEADSPPRNYHVQGSALLTGLVQDSGYDVHIVVHFISGERALAMLKGSVAYTLKDETPKAIDNNLEEVSVGTPGSETLPQGDFGKTAADQYVDYDAKTVQPEPIVTAKDTGVTGQIPAEQLKSEEPIILNKSKRGVRPGTGDNPLLGFEWDA
jgi:hypothetical protein